MTMVMEYGITIIGYGEVFLRWLFWPVYWCIEKKPPTRIPQNSNPLLNMSAVSLAKKIRSKELLSENVVSAYIKRIREVNPILNTVVEDRFDNALKEARAIDEALANATISLIKTEREKPFLGVPVTIKESCGVKDRVNFCIHPYLLYKSAVILCQNLNKGDIFISLPMSGAHYISRPAPERLSSRPGLNLDLVVCKNMSLCVGLVSRVEEKCRKDGDAVGLLREAGAIVLCVTTTPELCLSWETINHVTGRTLNPYNTHRTSGGSSGGEGALLGAGASVVGLGSDIAGSIRVPSMFNGIFGHKPTGGIVSVNGHFPNSTDECFSEFLVIGPMTRYAEDLKPVLKVISGKNISLLNIDEKVALNELTVYFMEELGNKSYDVPVDTDIKRAIVKSAKYLGDTCGATVNNAKFIELYDSVELSISVFFSLLTDIPDALQNPTNPKESSNLTLEIFKSFLGISDHALNTLLFYVLKETNAFIPRYKVPMYMKMFEATKAKLEEALGNNGVFLFPSFPVPAFNHYGLFCNAAGISYSMIFNLMGFPSTHVPLGLGSQNLPIGFQVIAAKNQDRICLAVAEELEKAFGGWVPPPTAK